MLDLIRSDFPINMRLLQVEMYIAFSTPGKEIRKPLYRFALRTLNIGRIAPERRKFTDRVPELVLVTLGIDSAPSHQYV